MNVNQACSPHAPSSIPDDAKDLSVVWSSSVSWRLLLAAAALLLLSSFVTAPHAWPYACQAAATWGRQPAVVRAVAFSPDGKLLASSGDSGDVTLWDAFTGVAVAILRGHEVPVRSLVFTKDGRQLVSGGGSGPRLLGELLVWDVAGRQLERALPWHAGPISAMALSDDGKKLAVGGSDGSVYCWRAADWSQGTAYRLHTGGVTALAFASQDDLLATAGDDRIKLWHADDGHVDQVLHASEGGSIFALAFTPDGRTLASSHGSDQSVRFWNLDTQCLQHCQRDTLGHVRALAFSRDGGFLAIAAGLWKEPGDVSLRPMRPGASRMTLRGHSNVAYCVAFSPDGRLLATGSGDETVRIWETATGKEIMTLQP